MTYWIVVGMPENFEIATKRKFDMFGFKSTRRTQSGEMRPGDKLVFYLTGVKRFGGIATVTSESFEAHSKVFMSEKKPNEDFPYRVKTKADIVLKEDDRLYVPDFVPRLEMTKKGAMKSWSLAFQGNLHKISAADYKLIEKEMKKRAGRKARAKKTAAKKPGTVSSQRKVAARR